MPESEERIAKQEVKKCVNPGCFTAVLSERGVETRGYKGVCMMGSAANVVDLVALMTEEPAQFNLLVGRCANKEYIMNLVIGALEGSLKL